MKALVTFLLATGLLVGCGSDDQDPNVAQFNKIRGMIRLSMPDLFRKIQSVPVEKLKDAMNEAANSGLLSEHDADVLRDPMHQQVLVQFFTLLQGGSNVKQKAAAVQLVSMTNGSLTNFSDILDMILEVLQVLGPVIGGLNPVIGTVIQLISTILPVILEIIDSITNPVLTYQWVPTAWVQTA